MPLQPQGSGASEPLTSPLPRLSAGKGFLLGGGCLLISFDSLMFHQARILLAFSLSQKVWPLLPGRVLEEEGGGVCSESLWSALCGGLTV